MYTSRQADEGLSPDNTTAAPVPALCSCDRGSHGSWSGYRSGFDRGNGQDRGSVGCKTQVTSPQVVVSQARPGHGRGAHAADPSLRDEDVGAACCISVSIRRGLVLAPCTPPANNATLDGLALDPPLAGSTAFEPLRWKLVVIEV